MSSYEDVPLTGTGKRHVYSPWSRELFADAAIVTGPARTVHVAGMGSEDPDDGSIHHPGDCAAQTRMLYRKITNILADEGGDLRHVVRSVTYLTDMRDKDVYEAEQRRAFAGVEPPPHSLIGVASLAWPGMVVEVEVTAVIPG